MQLKEGKGGPNQIFVQNHPLFSQSDKISSAEGWVSKPWPEGSGYLLQVGEGKRIKDVLPLWWEGNKSSYTKEYVEWASCHLPWNPKNLAQYPILNNEQNNY